MSGIIIQQNCSGCGRCIASCRAGAIILITEHPNGYGKKTASVITERCTLCGACLSICPRQALVFEP